MKRMGMLALVLAAMTAALCGCGAEERKTVQLSVWSYYNGEQLTTFNGLIEEFNRTVGAEEGIVVTGHSYGDIDELTDQVTKALENPSGASPLPNIFSAYADAAYSFDAQGVLVDCAPYLSEEERAQYVEGFLSEGDFYGDGSVKIFPVAKATEVFLLNRTDWDEFAEATGASYDDFSTIERLTALAQRYYEWTDSLSEEKNDGKAFFGRDAMDNYFYVGAMQLGEELFTVTEEGVQLGFSEQVAHKLWENYYVPFVKGYFAASGRFRTDDVKIGNVLALVGSSASATYFPGEVMREDGSSYPIEMEAFPAPQFEGSEGYAAQQGAGMVVTRASEEEVAASVTFLKWFTQPEQNIRFSVSSGYIPVTKEANDFSVIAAGGTEMSETVEKTLRASIETVQENSSYTSKPFREGEDVRRILKYTLSDLAEQNRETAEQRMAAGMELQDAVADLVDEESFEEWYRSTREALLVALGA